MTTDTRTEPTTTPLEPTTPIRPSEAIRLGCLLAPVQAFGEYISDDGTQACAVGALALGWGMRTRPLSAQSRFERMAGWDGDDPTMMPNCPACGEEGHGWPPHLNDRHHWSRERIADWLEGLGL